ncbi:MAG: exodeoxyribonuclease III [Gammaproteobacteria bacterium]|tara:strand:- start:952 stop:1764 length:813 start_codon:yes stop_codon:yes gene_type:complete
MIRIICFNINGLRARPHQLQALKEKYDPDVIALQEIKVSDEDFPEQIPTELGFNYYNYGQKGFHGVAIFSKQAPINIIKGLEGAEDEAQKRYIQCDYSTNTGPLSICNSYFPQGENRKHPDKFPYKDRYYKRITNHIKNLNTNVVLTGDFNIAPDRNDIGMNEDGIKRWLSQGHTAFLPEEIEWYKKLTDLGLVDIWRERNPDSTKCSWFDYRSRGFDQDPKRGLRIDHFLLSKNVQEKYMNSEIDHELRAMEKPSDHCPVVLDLDIDFA